MQPSDSEKKHQIHSPFGQEPQSTGSATISHWLALAQAGFDRFTSEFLPEQEFFQKHRKPIFISIMVVSVASILLTIPSVRELLRSRSSRWQAVREAVADKLSMGLTTTTAATYFPQAFRRSLLSQVLNTFYEQREYEPAWIGEAGNIEQLDSLLAILAAVHQDGFDTTAYHLQRLRQLRNNLTLKTDPLTIAQLDRMATAAFLLYASHIRWGRVDPEKLDTMWQATALWFNLSAHLATALDKQQLRQSTNELLPGATLYAYAALREKYRQLQNVQKRGGWPSVTTSRRLREGDRDQAVIGLKRRLVAEEDLDSTQTDMHSPVFDKMVPLAVKSYQQRHGLAADGTLTKPTLQALNVPLTRRIVQIAVNLERMRWLPRQYPSRSIWINIPEYKLRLTEKDQQIWETRVVVGKPDHPSPVLTDTLQDIILNPDWIVPASIAANEILPKIRLDPFMLEENQFVIYDSWQEGAALLNTSTIEWDSLSIDNFPYKIAQKPGGNNALVFPNCYDSYLHDTPAKGLFNATGRAHSHGCIRVEKPLQLAGYLLKDTGKWPEDKIMEISEMPDPQPEPISMTEKVAVTTVYFTAFMHQGKLHFCEDIYGYDSLHQRGLGIR